MPILRADYSNINKEEMAEAIGLKPKHIPMLIGSFLDESLSILNALEESIDAKDYDKIKSNAHAIKGSAGNLRFDAVYEMAKEMELSASAKNEELNYSAYLEAIKSAIATIQK